MAKINFIVSMVGKTTAPIRIVYRDSLRDDAAFLAIFDERCGNTFDDANKLLDGRYALCDLVDVIDYRELNGNDLIEFYVTDFRSADLTISGE